MTTTGNTTGFDRDDGEDLRDPALRRALDHAPDSDATPDARTRDAILKMAHNLAAVPAATRPAANSASAAPWWRRVFGGGGEPRSRMPWNAAFATVLVATFVTVLWHREPVPDAQLDGEARVGGAAAPAQAPVAPPLAPAPAAGPAPPSADAAPRADLPATAAAAPAAPEPAPPAAATAARRAQVEDQKKQQVKAPRDSSSAKEAAGAASADAVRRAAPPPQPAPQAASPAPIVPAPAVAAAPPPAIVAEQAALASPREERVESERRRAYADESPPLASAPAAAPAPAPAYAPSPPAAITAPAPAAVAPPQIAAAPPYQESKSRQSAFAEQAGNANADVSGALRSPAPRAAVAAKPARSQQSPASFSALDRWTSFSFTGSGGEVRHARGDIEGLPALVGTVARSATSADEPLAAPVDARLALYHGGTLVAVLEIAGAQVRWTPQPGGAALVGTPPAQTLDALRSLLTR